MDIETLKSRRVTLQEQINIISMRYGSLESERRDLQYQATILQGRVNELDTLIEELARTSDDKSEPAVEQSQI